MCGNSAYTKGFDMRILYLGNNRVGWQVLKWLKEQNEQVVGLVVHPPGKEKYLEEIIQAAELPREKIFNGSRLREPEVLQRIEALKPDIGLSVLFGYILHSEFLNIFDKGVINLHPAYLPFNRGAYPNVWSIVEETPAGVTIHYIDEKIDTGNIISQVKVEVESIDTGKTLYHKLEKAALNLFRKTWPEIKKGEIHLLKQETGGTFHRVKDVEKIDKIELDRSYSARGLINLLRARSFPPYRGAYFESSGRKVYLHLHLEYEEIGDANDS